MFPSRYFVQFFKMMHRCSPAHQTNAIQQEFFIQSYIQSHKYWAFVYFIDAHVYSRIIKGRRHEGTESCGKLFMNDTFYIIQG